MVSRGALIFVMGTACQLAQFGDATSFLRAGQLSEKDVDDALAVEITGGLGHAQLEPLIDTLRPMFATLEKDSEGRLEHRAVRYVLHRLFVARHGWYIKGLNPLHDPAENASSRPLAAVVRGKEWVPSFLQERFEKLVQKHSASLLEAAALAAALEDLVRKEVLKRLQVAYNVHEFNINSTIDSTEMDDLIHTYFVSFLMGNNFTVSNPREVHHFKELFYHRYTGWVEAEQWLDQLLAPFVSPEVTTFNLDAIMEMALKIGEEFHTLNDLECRELKSTLLSMEKLKPGRVMLADFYRMGKHSHWSFVEKAEYLKLLGALDDTDPERPMVIVPNYVMSRINCLEASHLYAQCCQNECEALMGHLEREVGEPEVTPDRIITLVEKLPSDTVKVPRQLSQTMLARLDEVAAVHGGRVPLHGRLFAQWMHHAYPRECPYPHERGTTSTLTPDEWTEATGAESASASDEEVETVCRAHPDEAAWNVASPQQDPKGEFDFKDLPWSLKEELIGSVRLPRQRSRRTKHTAFLLWVMVGAGLYLAVRQALSVNDKSEKRSKLCLY